VKTPGVVRFHALCRDFACHSAIILGLSFYHMRAILYRPTGNHSPGDFPPRGRKLSDLRSHRRDPEVAQLPDRHPSLEPERMIFLTKASNRSMGRNGTNWDEKRHILVNNRIQ
jgi:hypothetical protein